MNKSEYIYCANKTYSNLKEYEEIFDLEASVINYVKCCLLQNVELEDFYIDGAYVSVYAGNNHYDLYFDQYKMQIDVFDKQIVNYEMEAN